MSAPVPLKRFIVSKEGVLGRAWSIHRNNKSGIVIAVCLLALAVVFIAMTGDYVSETTTVAAPDLILSNIGPYNLEILFVWLFMIVILVFLLYPLIFDPYELPYAISMFSLLLIVRSGFVILTHLRPPDDAILVVFPGFMQLLNFSNDLFFSGHTGIPFLGFLIFRNNRLVRYFMLASSILLAVTVLLMHVHYSIDVLSAFCITYCVYKAGHQFIPRDDKKDHTTSLNRQHPSAQNK